MCVLGPTATNNENKRVRCDNKNFAEIVSYSCLFLKSDFFVIVSVQYVIDFLFAHGFLF